MTGPEPGGFCNGNESEDELQVTAIRIDEFKKQYDAMTGEENDQLPM